MNPNDEIEPRGHHLFERPLQRCPSCGSTAVTPLVDDGAVHFLCDECARCWHYELGSVWRVDPNMCAHCDHYERCAEVYAADRGSRPRSGR
jgi:hypothetical protein